MVIFDDCLDRTAYPNLTVSRFQIRRRLVCSTQLRRTAAWRVRLRLNFLSWSWKSFEVAKKGVQLLNRFDVVSLNSDR